MQVLRHAVFAIVVVWSAAPAHADDVAAAAKAFAQAQEVLLAGDLPRAADLYELADELAPSAPALRNAARARLQANHNAMAATHAAELLQRYPSDRESRAVAEAILSKLAPQLARIEVTCSASCTLQVDGRAASARARVQHSFFLQPGTRTLTAVFDDGRQASDTVTALINNTVTVKLEAPPRPVAPPVVTAPGATTAAVPVPPPRARGMSRKWVLGSALVTAGLGAAATLSGLQTLGTRDDIRRAAEAGATAEADRLYQQGRDQQLRTNILIGTAAAAGITTIVLAFATDWSGKARPAEVAVVPSGDGAGVVYGRRF